MNLFYWIVAGLTAVWLARQVLKGDGYGVLADTVIGVLGGIVGGWIFGMFGVGPGGGLIGSIVVAFIVALTLAQLNRAAKSAAPRATPIGRRSRRAPPVRQTSVAVMTQDWDEPPSLSHRETSIAPGSNGD